MSQQGPPADAKQAQAAALHEVEAAQRRKRALDMSLVSIRTGAMVWGAVWLGWVGLDWVANIRVPMVFDPRSTHEYIFKRGHGAIPHAHRTAETD